MSTSEKIATTPKAAAPLIENRFALRRKMASTALADVYWADDLHTPTQGSQDHIVLLILVAPTISALPDFAKAWSAVLSRPAPPAVSYPNILAWGNEGNNYWFTCSNTQGTLLSEYFNEIDKRGLTPDQALNMTEAVSHALNNVQAGAFGYFEPGATLRTDHGYVLLNAPIVKMMHSLLLQQTGGVRTPLALHSPWLSPPVAVGDIPVTEDDTFSMASLYQMVSVLQPPYGQQSTLTALARGTPAMANPKLKPEAQQLLTKSLSLQRNQRPENPEALLKELGRKNYRKLLLPVAALAAVGVVVYASYHLVSKFDGLLHEPNQQVAQTTTPSTASSTAPTAILGEKDSAVQPSDTVALVNETATKPVEVNAAVSSTPMPATNTASTSTQTAEANAVTTTTETNTTTTVTPTDPVPNTNPSNSEQISTNSAPSTATSVAPEANQTTSAEASQASAPVSEASNTTASPTTAPAISTNEASTETAGAPTETSPAQQAEVTELILKATEVFNAGNSNGTEGALSILRQVWVIDRQDPNARALLNKIIAQQQQQTESRINLNKPEEAKISLAQTDDVIREFNLTDRIEEQVRLESLIDIRERERREAGDLIQQARVAIKRGALTREDGANNAVSYLNKLMFVLPNNAEGKALLEQVVETRQDQIQRHLERNKLAKANSYLDETSHLIRKYNLTGQTRTQATLERNYRQAVEAAQAKAVIEQEQQVPVLATEPNSSEQVAAESNANVVIVEPELVEQPAINVPPPAEGEHYITPDDSALMQQAAPQQDVQTTIEATEFVPQQTSQPVMRTQTAPARPVANPAPQAAPVINEPVQQIQQAAPVPEQNQIVEQPAQAIQAEPVELPAETIIQAPNSTVVENNTVTINEQGVLNAQGAVAPTEEEIPDSERK